MSEYNKTVSGRVPEEDFNFVKESLEQEVSDGISKLIRSTFSIYREDEDFREFILEGIKEEDVSLRQYASNLAGKYDISEQDEEDVIIGIQEIVSGVQNRSYAQAVRGGEKFNAISPRIGRHAAEYLANLPKTYWSDIDPE